MGIERKKQFDLVSLTLDTQRMKPTFPLSEISDFSWKVVLLLVLNALAFQNLFDTNFSES